VATTSFLFTVTLNNEVDTAFTVDFDSADVTATVADSDYAANSGTLNFAGMADETQTITIDVTGDTTAEVDEKFFVNLSNVSAGGRNLTIDDSQGLGTIVNDDNALAVQKVCQPPELATGPFTITVYEGSLGGTLVDTLILNCGEGNTTNPIQVVPGATYVVAEETPPADTFLTYGGDCSADGRVVIDAGIVTCTVTNTEILPFLKFTDPEDEELASNEVFSWFVQVPLSTGSWSLIDWLPFGITLAGPIVEPAGVSCSEVLVFGFTCQGSDTGNVVIEVPVRAPAYCQTFTNTAFLTVDGGPAVTATDQVSVEDCALRKSGHASFPFSSGRRVA